MLQFIVNSHSLMVTTIVWQPPIPVKSWVLSGLILISLAAFLWALWPKLRVLMRSAGENRLDRPVLRVWNTLRIAFAQSKMFKDGRAGWMHALIFWGFLILLFRALQFFVIGIYPSLLYASDFSYSSIWIGYSYVKDFVVLLVTLACCYALFRRLVTKPKRLNLSGEAILILVLILIIMISDMVYDGANYRLSMTVLDGLSDSSFLGVALAKIGMINLSRDGLMVVLGTAYWTHIVSILIFIVILPRSKHFHIITSIPNVFLGNVTQTGNQLSRLDFEDESRETFGVTRIEEFSWKKLLDLHTCTECGRCDVFCPALNSDKPLSPKQFTIDLRNRLNDQTSGLLNKEAKESHALMGSVIQDATVWSCTTCGACEEECPVMIEYVNKMVDLRRGLVLTEDRYPKELGEAFKSLETHSNPWGFPGTQRAAWAKGLNVKQWDKDNPTEYLYFVGCNGSFDNRGKKVSESVVQALSKAGVDFSILGNREGCTGDPARRLGNEYLFDMLASQNAETLKEQGVIKVIVHCPHCFNSFKHEYPEFGVKLEVIHHSELLSELIKENKLSTEGGADETVVVHDSCYMGRHNKVYEAPRDILKSVTSLDSVKEVEASRERGTCCGAGGGGFLMEESGMRISHNRVDELMQAKPDTIAVSCPYCVLMLEDALKAKNLSDTVKVKDISEML
jgi:Fe-S oxidoreductase/nitrate reductase gamma subunit